MSMKKKTSALLIIVLIALFLGTGCNKQQTTAQSKQAEPVQAAAPQAKSLPNVNWKFTHSQSPENFQQKALEEFASYVSEKSGGKFKIEVFHSGTLGTEQEVIENMQMGSIAGTVGAASLLANFVPSYNLFALPALFKNPEQLESVMADDSIMGKLRDAANKADILDYGFYQSFFRQLYTQKPIKSVEDFKAMKIRVMGSEIILNTFQRLGSNPTTTAWAELYSALQLGVTEGMDHVAASVKANAFYENLKYVCEPNLFVTPMFVLVSKPMYEKLPAEYKAIIDDAVKNVLVKRLQELSNNANYSDLDWLKNEGGLEFVECDYEAIQKYVANVRDKYIAAQEPWVQEICKQIIAQN